MNWPTFFPKDCPPPESQPAAGRVYRLISGTNPDENDFKSYRELRPQAVFNVPECQTCGISIYTDSADVLRLKRRIPSMRQKTVAVGNLNTTMGKMLNTPGAEKSHHTWWIPTDMRVLTAFQVIILSEEK